MATSYEVKAYAKRHNMVRAQAKQYFMTIAKAKKRTTQTISYYIILTLTEFKKLNKKANEKGYNRVVSYEKYLAKFKTQMMSDPQLEWKGEDDNMVMLHFVMWQQNPGFKFKTTLPIETFKQHNMVSVFHMQRGKKD